jgi:ATP-dependent RNA helicase RhlE
MNFRDIGLAEPLLRAVLHEGYTEATPIQSQAIPAVLEGHDVIGIAQTGTGKTAAFALPILHQLINQPAPSKVAIRKIRVLVLASTRELAVQIYESFNNYGAFAGLRIATIYGGVGQQPQVTALRKGVDIVVATPGRLLDLIKQGYVDLKGIQTLILDEADRMLDMGFFPAIRRVLEYVPKKRQTLMFSATMKPEIRDLANSILRDPVSISIEPKQKTTELVDQSVCFVPQKQKTRLLVELLKVHNPFRAIVFSRTKHGADRIVRHLTKSGFNAEAIHANKSQNKRQRTLEQFKGNNPPILVATDIAARGIDVDQVSHVYVHDMPTEEETYVHRIGRSGRAGATGISISFCDMEERRMLRSIEKLIGMKINVLDISEFDVDSDDGADEGSSDDRDDRRSRSGSGQRGPQGQRGSQGSRGRRDHAPREAQGDRRPAPGPADRGRPGRPVHPLQAARAVHGERPRTVDSARSGDRPRTAEPGRGDRVPGPVASRDVREPRRDAPVESARRVDRAEPERRDLGRDAERQNRSRPQRDERPVSNLALRRQQRGPAPGHAGPSAAKPGRDRVAPSSEFGDGIEIDKFDSRSTSPAPRRRRRRPTNAAKPDNT